ncbi:MAG: cation diffusion facilitator family transporter [Zetaproteobacteria bacterium]|nr:cation diffusion facilitator family transporter [Zetaproteobacteria bacterium]
MNGLEDSQDDSLKALKVAAIGSAFLTIIKFAAFWMTGSVLALSAMYDSLADTFSSAVNHIVYRKSREEADTEHPFGHGGYEVVATLIQGTLIFVLGLSLLREAIERFQNPTLQADEYHALPLAAAILIFSAIGGLLIQFVLLHTIRKLEEKKERSLTLHADLAHYAGDVAVNLFSAVGLCVVYWSKEATWDGLFGLLGAGFLVYTSVPILHKAFRDIMHAEAPAELQQTIVDLVMKVDNRVYGIHELRSRELGPILFVDFHLSVESSISLLEAHHIAEQVQAKIMSELPRANILIHIDPHLHPEENSWEPRYSLPVQHLSQEDSNME